MSSFFNLFNRASRPPTRVTAAGDCQSTTKGSRGFQLFLVATLLLYWRFAVYFERIDLSIEFAEAYPLLAQMPIVFPIALMFREMFTLQAARHLIPVIVGWWLAYEAAVSVVQHLYDLPDAGSGRSFLGRLQSNSTGLGSSYETINPERLETDREKSILLRVGGPGRIRLPATYVGVTEMNDRFCRVLPPGKNTLQAFEYLHSILDLRQQDRFASDITFTSLDSLQFTASINIVYRIKTGDAPTQFNPYPFDAEAVFTAAYNQTVLDNYGTTIGWEDAPIKTAIGILSGIVRKYTLDEIFFPKGETDSVYEAIQNEFETSVRRKFTNDMGLKMLEAHVVNMELPEDIKSLYMEYWQSLSDAEIMLRRAEGQANAVERLEKARAEAEITMIDAILEGINKARKSGSTTNMSEIVALRIIKALERMTSQSLDSNRYAEKYLPTIDQMQHDLYYDFYDEEDTPPPPDSDFTQL